MSTQKLVTNDTDDTRQRILDAAEEIFAERGQDGATVRDILKKAGVGNAAAVNYYFGDKDRLYHEAVKYACRCCTQGEQFPEWPAGTPAAVKLRDFIRVMVRRMTAPHSPASLTLMFRELAQPTAAGEAVVGGYIRPIADTLDAILNELLPSDTPAMKRHLTAFSIVGQCMHYKHNRAVVARLVGESEFSGYEPDTIAAHIIDFTFRALGLDRVDGGS